MNYSTELDVANVVLIASNSALNQYGIVPVINDINEVIDEAPITAIAICKYDAVKIGSYSLVMRSGR